MGATVLTADGKQVPIVMGSYGIGVERIMSAAVELFHDDDGIIWPKSIAPFSVVLTPVNYRDEVRETADRLYEDLRKARVDALLDDRLERPGVKFKDADLIGIPYRVVIGEAKVKQGKVELFERSTRKLELVDLDSLVKAVTAKLSA
jgi:prolyl-tRNA synthetase